MFRLVEGYYCFQIFMASFIRSSIREEAWKIKLARELQASGLPVDMERAATGT